MYVVTVAFRVRPEHTTAFLAEMRENARMSVETEPGCHRFDVCVPEDNRAEVFLYELYSDRTAFDAHLSSPHFQAFSAETDHMVHDKIVRTFLLAEN